MKKWIFLYSLAMFSFASCSNAERCRVKLCQDSPTRTVQEYEKQGLLVGPDGDILVQSYVVGDLQALEVCLAAIPDQVFTAMRMSSTRFRLVQRDIERIREQLGGEIPHVEEYVFFDRAYSFFWNTEGEFEPYLALAWFRD